MNGSDDEHWHTNTRALKNKTDNNYNNSREETKYYLLHSTNNARNNDNIENIKSTNEHSKYSTLMKKIITLESKNGMEFKK